MQGEPIEELARETSKRALENVGRLLKKRHFLDDEDIAWLLQDAVEEIEFECPVSHGPRKLFRAAKFCVEYNPDDLELAVTYAFKNVAIIVLRERQEGTLRESSP